jgi:small subunit ribosomal protein S9
VTETPEDEQRNDVEPEVGPAEGAPEAAEPAEGAPSDGLPADAAAEEPAAEEPEPVAELPAEPAAEEPAPEPGAEEAAPEPVAEEPEPVAEEPTAEEPVGEPISGTEPEGSDAEVARAPSPSPAEASEGAPATSEVEATGSAQAGDEVEVAPRPKPEIPGADLEPDLMPDSDQYLDAEAQAAAEAEAEAAAERARAEAEDEQSRPIADAAIDLAAGARYTATGKRKTAVARVTLRPGGGEYLINGRSLETFFPRDTLQRMIRQPLETVGYDSRMDVIARMHGGGVAAQAGALRHGISRALIDADPNLRGELKRRGYLTRDPRVKERKKAGLKKARKRPQFSKR